MIYNAGYPIVIWKCDECGYNSTEEKITTSNKTEVKYNLDTYHIKQV